MYIQMLLNTYATIQKELTALGNSIAGILTNSNISINLMLPNAETLEILIIDKHSDIQLSNFKSVYSNGTLVIKANYTISTSIIDAIVEFIQNQETLLTIKGK